MGTHFIFRMEGTEYKGMRMHSGLYSAVVATVDAYKKRDFPYLLAGNTSKKRIIGTEQVAGFKEDLFEAGKIILTYPLLNYEGADDKTVILEDEFTAPQLAVRLATAIKLCDICIRDNKGVDIKIEDGSFDHISLSLEQVVHERDKNWAYLPDAKTVFDYHIRH